MGGTKRMMEEHEANVGGVVGRLEEAGAFSRCEVHEILIDKGDPQAVEEVREQLRQEMDESEADDLIEAALLEAGEECPICAKHRDE